MKLILFTAATISIADDRCTSTDTSQKIYLEKLGCCNPTLRDAKRSQRINDYGLDCCDPSVGDATDQFSIISTNIINFINLKSNNIIDIAIQKVRRFKLIIF